MDSKNSFNKGGEDSMIEVARPKNTNKGSEDSELDNSETADNFSDFEWGELNREYTFEGGEDSEIEVAGRRDDVVGLMTIIIRDAFSQLLAFS